MTKIKKNAQVAKQSSESAQDFLKRATIALNGEVDYYNDEEVCIHLSDSEYNYSVLFKKYGSTWDVADFSLVSGEAVLTWHKTEAGKRVMSFLGYKEVPLKTLDADRLVDILNSTKKDIVFDYGDENIGLWFDDFDVWLGKDADGEWDIATLDFNGEVVDWEDVEHQYLFEDKNDWKGAYETGVNIGKWLGEKVDYDRYTLIRLKISKLKTTFKDR